MNILKTLSQSGGPWTTGLLAGRNHFWAAFVAAGLLKATYDVLLLAFFAGRVPSREAGLVAGQENGGQHTEGEPREGETARQFHARGESDEGDDLSPRITP